jgi:hypothetical protein
MKGFPEALMSQTITWKRVTKADKKVVERTAPTRARQQIVVGDSKN